jgi:glycosyltransferase involved in cell wall biosynthesis
VSSKSGGAATYLQNLIVALANSRHRYVVFVPETTRWPVSGAANVTLVGTGIGYKPWWSRLFWDQVTLRRIVKANRADVLLSSSDFGMLWPPCKQILLIRNPLFFSQLYADHIWPHKSRTFKLEFLLRRWLVNLSAQSSDLVMTASHSMRNDAQKVLSLPETKLAVNYFGVPCHRFPSLATVSTSTGGVGSRPFMLLYVSEYSDYKNLTTLLRAALMLREQGNAEFRLIATADPSQRPSEDLVTRQEDLALTGHPLLAPVLQYTGPVAYAEIPRLYAQSDLFVFPSLAESFAHPLVEAMASGLPIVASDIPLCREICGDAALYFDPLDHKELAERVRTLWQDAKLRQRLGAIGSKRAVEQFDWNDHVNRLVRAIEVIAGQECAA